MFVGTCFPQNCPFSFLDRHPHVSDVTRCSSGQEYSSQTACRSVQPFCVGPKRYVVRCFVNGEKLPRSPIPLGISHRAGGGPTHGHRQHAQKLGKDRTCGSGDILADRQTHTDMIITILRNCFRRRSN